MLLRRLGEVKLRELQARGLSVREIERRLDADSTGSSACRTVVEMGCGWEAPSSGAVDALEQLTLDQGVFLRTFDALPAGVLLFDLQQRPLHANAAAASLLESGGERLHEEVRALAAALCRSGVGATDSREAGGAAAIQEVSLPAAGCCLRGSRLGRDRLGRSGLVLIVLERISPVSLPDPVLRERWKLTRKEIRVARLLAEGRSNTGIAAALCISTHTARHHTERVLSKLGVKSRAAVGMRLRGEDAAGAASAKK